MTQEYKAIYGINHGATVLGRTVPEYTEVTEIISADSSKGAMRLAIKRAGRHSVDWLCDPMLDGTRVRLLSLRDQEGTELDQQELYPRGGFNEKGQAGIYCPLFLKVLMLPESAEAS